MSSLIGSLNQVCEAVYKKLQPPRKKKLYRL